MLKLRGQAIQCHAHIIVEDICVVTLSGKLRKWFEGYYIMYNSK